MKCEICHNHEAETAIHVMKDGVDEELYVCRACAKNERVRRQKKSQRTHREKVEPPDVAVSISGITTNGEPPPPQILEAFMNAMNGVVNDLERIEQSVRKSKDEPTETLSVKNVRPEFCVGDRIHLEGLHLIGELESVHRAMQALKMRLVGVDADGIHEAGHVFSLQYSTKDANQAERVLIDLIEQERNARVRLVEEMPRVFGDSICRALAVLKNCRLLAPGELFDLLSPLRLAAIEDLLDGVTLNAIEKWLAEIDLTSREDKLTPDERDRVDGERADEMNRRFEDVVLNERAEGKFL